MNKSYTEKERFMGMYKYGFGIQAMKGIKVCNICGSVENSRQLFCKSCMHILPHKSVYELYKEKHKYCSMCDTVLSDASRYCPQCGERITD